MKTIRIQIAAAAVMLMAVSAASAYHYQPEAQVVITDTGSQTATITTRERFFSTPKVEKVKIAQRAEGNVLFCKHGGYPSVQYHCRSTGYGQATNFDRTAVGVEQHVELRWTENLLSDS